ncbi:hypothetical protein Nepgr_026858 [Nepenthes gracilis]|uniref:Uncharacterized protein n=1 Tax=Nepenthes gracilis TaxID=150966 RepID=A0AAD3T8T8_NEPGR|nr:hypothetical protein Nepgr_026858 [Nepenthes gracilis]
MVMVVSVATYTTTMDTEATDMVNTKAMDMMDTTTGKAVIGMAAMDTMATNIVALQRMKRRRTRTYDCEFARVNM